MNGWNTDYIQSNLKTVQLSILQAENADLQYQVAVLTSTSQKRPVATIPTDSTDEVAPMRRPTPSLPMSCAASALSSFKLMRRDIGFESY